jgi:putative ABC transport system permease protein
MTKAIQLKGVSRHFKLGTTDVQALNNIELEIEQGEFIALIGPSGSGKSTLLNLLGGLDRPSSGEIDIQAWALHNASETELDAHRRHNVGFVFQSFNLLPTLTAIENVALPLMISGVPLQDRNQQAEILLKRVGLGHRLLHRPGELSGGEQQRAAIARALINSPQFILTDEPTGNLDSSTGEEVMGLLRNLNKEKNVNLIVVTHNPEIAKYADRVVHLKDGKIEKIEVLNESQDGIKRESLQELLTSSTLNKGLSFRDLLRTARDNLIRRPIRNILTATGVLIGIVTLVAMVSFGVGVQEEVKRNFEALGLENVFISPVFPENDNAFDPFGFSEPILPLTPEIVSQFENIPEVLSVSPVLNLPSNMEINLSVGDQSIPVRVSDSFGGGRPGMPSPPEMLEMHVGVPLGEGFTQGITIIEGLADQFLENTNLTYADLIGQTVELNIRLPRGETNAFEVTIIGIEAGNGSNSITLGLAERSEIKAWWYGRPNTLQTDGYDMLIIKAENQFAVPAVLDAAESMEVEAQSLGALLEIVNRVLSIMQALLGSVGGLALLVATLGVANTMMMSIYERTREIGVLKALGATSKEVRRLFTADAILLGTIGGFVGVIFGTLLGKLVNYIGHWYLESQGVYGIGQMSVVPPWLAIGALIFAAFIGVLGGLYPASRAAKLDPVVALKHE